MDGLKVAKDGRISVVTNNAALKKRILWVVVLPLCLAALALLWSSGKGTIQDDMESNEKTAQDTLRKFSRVESEFRANDLDGNRVLDSWTGDVASLYALDTGAGPLKLIDQKLALADAAPLKPWPRSPFPTTATT